MNNKLVFASNNEHKLKEIKSLLTNEIDILSLKEIGFNGDIDENGKTIEENAIIKATYISNLYGYPCFADDSGLEVEALHGAPGVISARYAGEQKNDHDNIQKLLQELSIHTNRKANFKTVIALCINNKIELFKGIIYGEITHTLIGSQGFGYDPIFIPEGYNKTFAEMTLQEKSTISHRSIAVKKLIDFIKKT